MNIISSPTSVKAVMQERLIGLLRKPAQEQREKRPHNKLWIASLGFNATMCFLDLISAVTVAMLTNALYGALTFLAGFLALLLHENLFTNPHANMSQKWIAIGGGALAILSTVVIGVLAGLVNVLNLAHLVPIQNVEVGIIIALVCIAGTHGVMWGVYYFTDAGHVAAMKTLANHAYRERQRQNFEEARKDIETVKKLHEELEKMGDDAPLLQEAYKLNTGHDLITPQAAPATTPHHSQELRPAPSPFLSRPRVDDTPIPVYTDRGNGDGHKPI